MTIGFAHRGAPRLGTRENTLHAFRAALARGARGLESDVWLTADGVPVLHHDGVLGRPWRRVRLAAMQRAALPRWLPPLERLYEECGTAFLLSLDIKDPRAVNAVVAVARAAGASGALWLCGPVDQVSEWRSAVGDEVHLVDSARLASIAEGVPARARALQHTGVEVLNMRQDEWSEPAVTAVREAGRLAFGWDANSRGEVARLLRLGCHGIYSDHVGLLRRLPPETPAAALG